MSNNESSELQLGTEVEIIGPSNSGGMSRMGKKFVISEILTRIDSKSYSADNLSWYPASSLRLVEGLKIGDWVEVIKFGNPWTGEIEKIIGRDESDCPIQLEDKSWWRPMSLRKLTPEEIKQHVAASKIKQFDGEIAHLLASVQECLIESGDVEARAMCREMKINDRLSAIEQRQSAICSYNIETEQRLQKLEAVQKLLSQLEIRQDNHGKRLADVEFILSEMKKIFKTKDRSVNFIFETV